MAWWIYVLIIFVVVCSLGFVFYFFQMKKEDKVDDIEVSKTRLDDMVASFDILIELSKDNEKLKDRLEDVQDKIRYSIPSANKKMILKDTRIVDRIGDLKILLARAKTKGTYFGCERALTEIELLIVERNSEAK